ncbi:AI-2E family transporter [Aerococcus sp. UMB7834]|uniref:AI-2E family transporter n=1 Tax=Aerococcus sp. UMB7834 TaxID=3046342 RepID=UPI00254F125D|nr:AI-2E family transporter [Aerococcus sp. UMB7834]MDK6805758.1 AI-2E family transporter [Aerococcus sp. UMB7834]
MNIYFNHNFNADPSQEAQTTKFWGQVLKRTFKNIWVFAWAQVKLLALVFVILGLGLHYLGIPWAWLLALVIALLDALPVIGSGIVFVPWILYQWLLGDTTLGFWLLGLYLVVALLKQALEPFFLGRDLALPVWVTLLVTIICTLVFNVMGIVVSALVIPFLSAYRQVRRDFQDQKRDQNKEIDAEFTEMND